MLRLPLPSVTLRLTCTALCNRFSTLVPVLDRLAKQASITVSLHLPFCIFCLVTLNMIPKSLSAPVAPHRKPVSTALSPVRSTPFRWPRRELRAPVNPCVISLMVYVLPPPFLEPILPPASLNPIGENMEGESASPTNPNKGRADKCKTNMQTVQGLFDR